MTQHLTLEDMFWILQCRNVTNKVKRKHIVGTNQSSVLRSLQNHHFFRGHFQLVNHNQALEGLLHWQQLLLRLLHHPLHSQAFILVGTFCYFTISFSMDTLHELFMDFYLVRQFHIDVRLGSNSYFNFLPWFCFSQLNTGDLTISLHLALSGTLTETC